jgi:hypothetical protein
MAMPDWIFEKYLAVEREIHFDRTEKEIEAFLERSRVKVTTKTDSLQINTEIFRTTPALKMPIFWPLSMPLPNGGIRTSGGGREFLSTSSRGNLAELF